MSRLKKLFRNGFFFPRSAMVFANGNLVPERNYRYRRGLVRRNDTVQWHEPRRRLPGEDAVDGVVDMEDDSKRLGVVQLVFEVYTRAWAYKEIDTTQKIRSVRALDPEILHCMHQCVKAPSHQASSRPVWAPKWSETAHVCLYAMLRSIQRVPVHTCFHAKPET